MSTESLSFALEWVSVLKRIGALAGASSEAEEGDSAAFEWILSTPNSFMSLFIPWASQSLRRDNVLSRGTLTKFEELKSSHRVLEGEELASALETAEQTTGTRATQDLDAVRNEIRTLRAELVEAKREKRKAESRRNTLQQLTLTVDDSERSQDAEALSKSAIEGKNSSLCAISDDLGDEMIMRELQMSLSKVDREIDDAITKCSQLCAELVEDYEPDGPTSRFDDSPFLAYTPLTRYAEADDDFVNALQKYMVKLSTQHSESLTEDEKREMTLQHPRSERFEIKDVLSDPELLLLVRGESEDARNQHVEEVSRLSSSYKLTRLQRAAVGIAHSRALGVHDYLSSRVSEMDNLQRDHSLTVGSDVQATLRRWKEMASEWEHECSEIESIIERRMREDLPRTLTELSSLIWCDVLQGDYELKVARQQYQLEKFARIVDELIRQSGRHLFLQNAFVAEIDRLRVPSHTIESIESLLKQESQALSLRLNAYTELLERRSQLERRQSSALPRSLSDGYGAIDPRDPVWSGLHRILSSQQRFDELVLRSLNAEEEDTPVPELARARLQAALSLAKELLATIYSSNRDDQLLPDSSSSRTTHLFVSARQVIGQVREIVQRLEIAEATQEASAKSILATKKQLEDDVEVLRSMLCRGGSLGIVFVPDEILDREHELEDVSNRLAHLLQDLSAERKEYLSMLERQTEDELQRRRLFCYFFSNSAQLIAVVQRLQRRLGFEDVS